MLLPLGPCPSRPELKRNFHPQGASMMNRATFSAPLCATALLALVAVSFGEAQAQSAVITGKVTGRQGEALGGAIVVIDEFSAAVATTTQGTYTLTLAPERTKGQTVRLRAATSLTSPSACGGATCASTDVPGPLLIVDGTITRHGLSDINSEDIERVEVVKGAAASSLYGSDAANGVVQIFTKRGERIPDGKLSVTVRNEYGQSFRPKSIPTAMAYPYLTDTLGTYTDANGNTVTNGAYIDASGNLLASTAQPSEKADGMADLP